MTGHAWNDNNYEGKALRRVFTKLLKRFEKEIIDHVETEIKLTKDYVLQFLKKKVDEMEAPWNVTVQTPYETTKPEFDTINS